MLLTHSFKSVQYNTGSEDVWALGSAVLCLKQAGGIISIRNLYIFNISILVLVIFSQNGSVSYPILH
jgi:hypothetical protein